MMLCRKSGLWLAGAQGLSQRTPLAVLTRIQIFQQATDVAWPVAVQVKRGLGRIDVAACRIAIDEAKRDECVEEVLCAALIDAELQPQLFRI